MKYASLIALLALVGCGVKAPIEGRHDPYVPPQVQFTSERLRTDTAIGTPNPSRDQYGYLHVSVPIRAATNKQLYIDYRFTFYDRNGQPIGEATSWFHKTLNPNTFDQITANSTSTAAADFQVELRYTRIE
jgi:uncharacterized protein YcfL